ncbi:MAG: hypothetical protein HYY93_15640 [Planctomycetes bacterium]|nr:hypothetical protein [Planctomycetota bacterium]
MVGFLRRLGIALLGYGSLVSLVLWGLPAAAPMGKTLGAFFDPGFWWGKFGPAPFGLAIAVPWAALALCAREAREAREARGQRADEPRWVKMAHRTATLALVLTLVAWLAGFFQAAATHRDFWSPPPGTPRGR